MLCMVEEATDNIVTELNDKLSIESQNYKYGIGRLSIALWLKCKFWVLAANNIIMRGERSLKCRHPIVITTIFHF